MKRDQNDDIRLKGMRSIQIYVVSNKSRVASRKIVLIPFDIVQIHHLVVLKRVACFNRNDLFQLT